MPRVAVAFACWLILLLSPSAASSLLEAHDDAGQAPAFRTGVDVVQLDVTVLDRDRQPVEGLTAADFTVLDNGVPRPIVAFTRVALEAQAEIPPGPLAAIAPDITTNAAPDGRLVVILLDQSTRLGAPAVLARHIARAAVDALGPGDLAAVVHTNHGRSQNFTADRALLKAAVEQSALGMNAPGPGAFPTSERGECPCGICSIEAITGIAGALAADQSRRKTLLFIGESIALHHRDRFCDTFPASDQMLRAAQAAHLTIHTFDPNGLQGTFPGAGTRLRAGESPMEREQTNRSDLVRRHASLRTLAEETGGRAVLNTNAPIDSIRGILDETASYYLIGFQRAERRTDRGFRRITVRVNRPGLEVRTRRGYFPPRAREATIPVAPSVRTLDDVTRALLPTADLPLTLSAAPFAAPTERGATIVVTLGVGPAGDAGASDSQSPAARTEQVEILATAHEADGSRADWARQRFDLLFGASGDGRYEAVSRIDVKPGRYEVRVGTRHETSGRTGSVHGYVDVPDFAREPLSLSGVVLSDPLARHATPLAVLSDLLVDAPTTRRAFGHADEVTATVRVYQRRSGTVAPVELSFRILDGALDEVWSDVYALTAADFDASRSAERRMILPLAGLAPAAYVLVVQAAREGAAAARRQMRFAVR